MLCFFIKHSKTEKNYYVYGNNKGIINLYKRNVKYIKTSQISKNNTLIL